MGSFTKNPRGPTGPGTRAAVYMRMSTDHQRYSIESQIHTLAAYAVARGIAIVSAYADEGKSGVRLKGRAGLQDLIADAQAPNRKFDVVLIVDVSRWGRFQNADESAHYEFLCWQAGVALIYCGEAFENDGSPMSSVIKGMRRVMAAEYSRDLSRRVAAGKILAARRGGHAGGPVAYGLRRVLVDENGVVKHELASGERRAFARESVRVAPGPAAEVDVIRRIFTYFGTEGRSIRWICDKLNGEGIPSPHGSIWGHETLRFVLSNETYLGVQIYNRSSFFMKEARVPRAESEHVRTSGLFEPLISPALFARAAKKNTQRVVPKTNAELLDILRTLHNKWGRISQAIINADVGTPGSQTYINRFGSLLDAYEAAGVASARDTRRYFLRGQIAEIVRGLRDQLVSAVRAAGHRGIYGAMGSVIVDGAYTVGIRAGLYRAHRASEVCWSFVGAPREDLVLVICLNEESNGVAGQFLFLSQPLLRGQLDLRAKNNEIVEAHRVQTMDDVLGLAERLNAGEVTQPLGRLGQCRQKRRGDHRGGEVRRPVK